MLSLSHLPVKSMVPPRDVEPSVSEWWHLSIVGMEFLMPESVLQFQSEGQQQLGQLNLRYLKDSADEGRY